MNDLNQVERESRFVALITDAQLPLTLYVRSLLPGDAAAKDVAQQVNAVIWRRRDQFQIGTNFKAWAFSIARYEVLNYRKQQARDSRLVFTDELAETLADELAAQRTNFQRRHEALQHCLQKLRPQDRQLIMHRYSSKGTLADFAKLVNRSVGGLKVTLHRLRTSLQACIEQRLRIEGDAS